MTLEQTVAQLLRDLGFDHEDDEENPHLMDTPRRVAAALKELTTPVKFEFTTFDNKDIDQMITVKDVQYYSLCAHHMLPFFGSAHIAYIPRVKIVGLSKLPRTVEYFMRGLNIQEEMTKDILDFLVEHLEPKGAMVVLEGHHLCMTMRGVETLQHSTITSALHGVFLDPERGARQEFLELIRG